MKIFKVNQRLQIIQGRGNHIQQFSSRVEEVIPGQMIIIAMPMKKGSPIHQERGREIQGKIFDETGVYSFKSIFVDKKMTPIPIWIIKMPYDIEKTQQRAFVRMDVAIPVTVEYTVHHQNEEELVSRSLSTKDLSAGGLQFISPEPIKVGTVVKLNLDVPDFGIFQIESEVVRRFQPAEDRQLFWISVKFIDIPVLISDKISRFIFKKQLEQRQKGL